MDEDSRLWAGLGLWSLGLNVHSAFSAHRALQLVASASRRGYIPLLFFDSELVLFRMFAFFFCDTRGDIWSTVGLA